MKCYICDKQLTSEEIKFDRDHKKWDPCKPCLDIINDVFEDPITEEEIDALLESELVAASLLPENVEYDKE